MPPRRARKKPTKTAPADLAAVDYKRLKLEEVRADLQQAREEGRITGIAQLHRLEVQLHDEIAAALRAQAETSGPMTSAELMAHVLETILELPQGMQDQIGATLDAVRDGSIVKLEQAPKKRRRGGSRK